MPGREPSSGATLVGPGAPSPAAAHRADAPARWPCPSGSTPAPGGSPCCSRRRPCCCSPVLAPPLAWSAGAAASAERVVRRRQPGPAHHLPRGHRHRHCTSRSLAVLRTRASRWTASSAQRPSRRCRVPVRLWPVPGRRGGAAHLGCAARRRPHAHAGTGSSRERGPAAAAGAGQRSAGSVARRPWPCGRGLRCRYRGVGEGLPQRWGGVGVDGVVGDQTWAVSRCTRRAPRSRPPWGSSSSSGDRSGGCRGRRTSGASEGARPPARHSSGSGWAPAGTASAPAASAVSSAASRPSPRASAAARAPQKASPAPWCRPPRRPAPAAGRPLPVPGGAGRAEVTSLVRTAPVCPSAAPRARWRPGGRHLDHGGRQLAVRREVEHDPGASRGARRRPRKPVEGDLQLGEQDVVGRQSPRRRQAASATRPLAPGTTTMAFSPRRPR